MPLSTSAKHQRDPRTFPVFHLTNQGHPSHYMLDNRSPPGFFTSAFRCFWWKAEFQSLTNKDCLLEEQFSVAVWHGELHAGRQAGGQAGGEADKEPLPAEGCCVPVRHAETMRTDCISLNKIIFRSTGGCRVIYDMLLLISYRGTFLISGAVTHNFLG